MINKSKEHIVIVPFNEFNRLAATVEVCMHLLGKGDRVKLIYLENKYHFNKITGLKGKLGKDTNYPMNHLFGFLEHKGVKIERKSLNDINSSNRIESFVNVKLTDAKKIKELNYEGYNVGLGIYSSLSSSTNCSQPDLSKYDEIIKRFLYETAFTIECCLEINKENKFSDLHVFNGRFHHSRAIVEVFKLKNVDISYYEIVAYNGFKLLTQPEPIHNFSYRRELVREMWEKGPQDKKELGALFYNNDHRLKDKSSKTFHGNQTQNLIPEKKKDKRWVYYTSSDDEYESLSDVFVHPIFESQKQGVLWLINEVSNKVDTELIIRVHPHKSKKCKADADWWNCLKGKNMTLIDAYSKTDTYALAQSSDVVMCYNSTMGLESTYSGKPVIMLGDSFYRGLECGYEPNNIPELNSLLNQEKLDPYPQENCLLYGYYMYARGLKFNYYKPETLITGSFDELYHGFWKNKNMDFFENYSIRAKNKLKRIGRTLFRKKG